MNLRYGSICSGIEAASVAWEPLGWKPVFFSEIEKHPSNVLRYHWPDIPNLGDFTAIAGKDHDIDVLVGGTPCQAFSVAGRRQSLEDDRGNLTLKFVELVHESDVPIAIWENVPGVLNTEDNAFGCLLSGLVGSDTTLVPLKDGGWPCFGMVAGPQRVVAWRVFDAQYQRVAQRRRRLFLVSFRTGDGRNPGAVLFEPESLPRDTAPRRKKGERIAPTITGGPPFSRTGNSRVESEAMVTGTFRMTAFGEYVADDSASTVKARDYKDATDLIAFNWQNAGNDGLAIVEDGTGPLDCSQTKAICFFDDEKRRMRVRRLMPIEGERLQGFPDNHTKYGRTKDGNEYELADGPRYMVIGNSMAVPCMAWIGRRIEKVLEATQYSK
ncbi:hypothetical protein SYK_07110 [Pseudodesulfovibrio nedwellii]|uniref:DNA (cytosine-5-)-methyltransferase n=1 Tax=Pseudodesulfovibrio nedwellii TaxID=2973072 RepID=A0ABM8AXW6_9BACT|nr:DNA cytosine methyltransferase [Pseudodesulfovibrio nedwellii]BDQ36351.1 hypothetical protein SYK_07110 [Pseudodesulfovibrio nedwellii]